MVDLAVPTETSAVKSEAFTSLLMIGGLLPVPRSLKTVSEIKIGWLVGWMVIWLAAWLVYLGQ